MDDLAAVARTTAQQRLYVDLLRIENAPKSRVITLPDHSWRFAADLRVVLTGLVEQDNTAPAAVARLLAEAEAVHPAVHTPARVTNFLEHHGWQRVPPPPDRAPAFLHWIGPNTTEVIQALFDDIPDYAAHVHTLVWGVRIDSGRGEQQILLEIAQEPDEVAW